MFDESSARLQTYVDDPVLTAAGGENETDEIFDIAILWWLVLGARLSWRKGSLSDNRHQWIGIEYSLDERSRAIMELTSDYKQSVLECIRPLAHSHGTASLTEARTAVGKAQRVAQVVPEAQPYASGLWKALTEATQAAHTRREAPPGRVPRVRFGVAAQWFVALLEGAVLPLRRVVEHNTHMAIVSGPLGIAFDASPWGWGAVRFHHHSPDAWAAGMWSEALLHRFKAKRGDPAHQSLWEHVAELVALILWAPCDEPFAVFGDNLGALNNLSRLRGRSTLLPVAREFAWRQAAFRWKPLPTHRPAELNTLPDALSRLVAPKAFEVPRELHGVPRTPAPDLDAIWRAWLPPRR